MRRHSPPFQNEDKSKRIRLDESCNFEDMWNQKSWEQNKESFFYSCSNLSEFNYKVHWNAHSTSCKLYYDCLSCSALLLWILAWIGDNTSNKMPRSSLRSSLRQHYYNGRWRPPTDKRSYKAALEDSVPSTRLGLQSLCCLVKEGPTMRCRNAPVGKWRRKLNWKKNIDTK